MKRLLSVLLAVMLMTGAAPLQTIAADAQNITLSEGSDQMYGGYVKAEEPVCLGADPNGSGARPFSDEAYDMETAARALCEKMADYQTTIDVSSYHIPVSELSRLWQYEKDRYGELFHVQGVKYYYNSQNEISKILPKYTMTAEEYAEAKDIFDGKISAVVSQMEESFTNLHKVLFVHDYLTANFEYDVEGLNSDSAIYDAYQFLTIGRGVCQAYTLTFETMMDRLGISVSYVQSTALGHIWNMVQIGEKWYQLDITHDDPIVDNLGAAAHTHFLMSDNTMKEIKEVTESDSDWVYGTDASCTDTSYEAWFWTEISSPFVYDKTSDSWYCVRSGASQNGLCQWDGKQNSCTLTEGVQSLSGWQNGTGQAASFPAGLAAYHGNLYFSAPDGVYQYDLATKGLTKPVDVSDYYSVERIYGLRIVGNTLSYDYRASASSWARTVKTLELSPYTDVGDIYGWYAEDNAVYIHIPENTENSIVIVAWYSGCQLIQASMYTGPGDYSSLGSDGWRCRLMALAQGTLSPLCGAVTVSGEA